MRRAPTETGWTDGLERISPPVNDPGDLLDWQTLTFVDENRAGNLLAGGYILFTWEDQPPAVEGIFSDLYVAGQFVWGDEYSAIIKPYTDRISNSRSPEELSGAVMTFIRPKPSPRWREYAIGAAIYLASSWVNETGTEFNHVGPYPLTKIVEAATMLLVLLPGRCGLYLGGSVYLNRAMLVPWAAGAINPNSTLWGWREMESVSKIGLDDSDSDHRAYKKN